MSNINSLFDIQISSLDLSTDDLLGELEGFVLLHVNIATKTGYKPKTKNLWSYARTAKSLWELQKLHEMFSHKKISVVDESPFMDFTYKCHGIPVDPVRASRLAGAEKKKQGKKIKFRHTPSDKTRLPSKQEFSNTSGNQNSNKKYLILKN